MPIPKQKTKTKLEIETSMLKETSNYARPKYKHCQYFKCPSPTNGSKKMDINT